MLSKTAILKLFLMLKFFRSFSDFYQLARKKQNLKHPAGLVSPAWCKLSMFVHWVRWSSDRARNTTEPQGPHFILAVFLSQYDLLKPLRKYFIKQIWIYRNTGRIATSCRNTFCLWRHLGEENTAKDSIHRSGSISTVWHMGHIQVSGEWSFIRTWRSRASI